MGAYCLVEISPKNGMRGSRIRWKWRKEANSSTSSRLFGCRKQLKRPTHDVSYPYNLISIHFCSCNTIDIICDHVPYSTTMLIHPVPSSILIFFHGDPSKIITQERKSNYSCKPDQNYFRHRHLISVNLRGQQLNSSIAPARKWNRLGRRPNERCVRMKTKQAKRCYCIFNSTIHLCCKLMYSRKCGLTGNTMECWMPNGSGWRSAYRDCND